MADAKDGSQNTVKIIKIGGGTSILEQIRSEIRPIQATDRTTKRGGLQTSNKKALSGSEHEEERKMVFPELGASGQRSSEKNHFVGCGARAGLL